MNSHMGQAIKTFKLLLTYKKEDIDMKDNQEKTKDNVNHKNLMKFLVDCGLIERFLNKLNGRGNDPLFRIKNIQETYMWNYFNSLDEFFEDAKQAGMIEGKDYWVTPDGSVFTSDFNLETIFSYWEDEYSDEDLVQYYMDPKNHD